jgi:hypothetical protein
MLCRSVSAVHCILRLITCPEVKSRKTERCVGMGKLSENYSTEKLSSNNIESLLSLYGIGPEQ